LDSAWFATRSLEARMGILSQRVVCQKPLQVFCYLVYSLSLLCMLRVVTVLDFVTFILSHPSNGTPGTQVGEMQMNTAADAPGLDRNSAAGDEPPRD